MLYVHDIQPISAIRGVLVRHGSWYRILSESLFFVSKPPKRRDVCTTRIIPSGLFPCAVLYSIYPH